MWKNNILTKMWGYLTPKVSKYRGFTDLYFPIIGLDTEIYRVNLRIQSEYKKYGPEKSLYLDTFTSCLGLIIPLFLDYYKKLSHSHVGVTATAVGAEIRPCQSSMIIFFAKTKSIIDV